MAFYTPISASEANSILTGYELGELTKDPQPVEKGNNNSVYILHATTGDYVLKIYEPSIDPFTVTTLQERHDFQRFCFSQGIEVPALIGPVGTFKNRTFEIAHKIDGMHLGLITPLLACDIGQMLATFHMKTKDSPQFHTKNPPSPLSMLSTEIMGSVRRAIHSGNAAGEIRYISIIGSAAAEKINAMLKLPKLNLPKGKIHGDMNGDNIMLDADNKLHLLDLERTSEGFLVSDIAQAVVRICNHKKTERNNGVPAKEVLDKECVEKLLEGYNSVRRLTREELDILPLSIYAQSRFYQLAVEKQGLTGRKSDDVVDPKRLREELRKYNFFEMTGNEKKHASYHMH